MTADVRVCLRQGLPWRCQGLLPGKGIKNVPHPFNVMAVYEYEIDIS